MPMAAIPMPAQTLTAAAAATEPATMAAANNLRSPGRPESSVSQSEVGSCTAMAHAVNVAGHEAEEWGDAQDFALSVDGNSNSDSNSSSESNNNEHFRFMDFQTVAVNYFFFF